MYISRRGLSKINKAVVRGRGGGLGGRLGDPTTNRIASNIGHHYAIAAYFQILAPYRLLTGAGSLVGINIIRSVVNKPPVALILQHDHTFTTSTSKGPMLDHIQ